MACYSAAAMSEHQPILYRPARRDEARLIATLFRICAGGVADYVWSTMQEPGESLIDVGARRYEREDTPFSYQNCVMAEVEGRVVGMMVAYPIPVEPPASEPQNEPDPESAEQPDPVLVPYAVLEAPGTLYVACEAVEAAYRNRGIGEGFLEVARERARTLGLDTLSLLVFEQNAGSLRFHRRHGFREVARHPVVPHPLIEYTGDVVLFTAPVEQPG